MLVVSDATPINILLRIGHADILPKLFGRVVIPPAVAAEMAHSRAPDVVRRCIENTPTWLEIRAPNVVEHDLPLGAGEREAIALARELNAVVLLVDDRKARRAASLLGLPITGTLGLLKRADQQGLLDIREAIRLLMQTDFALTPALVKAALDKSPAP
jgi:predicted nucleic acid-binding protein